MDVGGEETVYGDLDGDGREEATVSVTCGIGSTGGSALRHGYVVVRARNGMHEALATLTPQQNPAALPATRLAELEISVGKIVVTEGCSDRRIPSAARAGRRRPRGPIPTARSPRVAP